MITQENFIEIKKYLASKNLSLTLFVEVYDHFVMQVSELMLKNSINFQEAFIRVKWDWKSELEMVKADTFSFRKIARIEKNILQTRFRKIIYISLGVSVALGMVGLISELLFFYLEMGVLLFLILILMYNFIWKKMSFTEYRNLSFHPLLLRNIIIGVLIFPLGSYFSGTFEFWKPVANQIIMIYAAMVQIQLLYFRTKKINVLFS
ncbi:MAG: hypothetical protein P0Y62_11470 [Candidatus Chryseobacterium colombiense]|nr:hypothetical protein [Chryseobacterium sp.]WEK68479.1 MAG: hypothetical protein P0Y62_11470 [Chryseobacterium sp.]